MPETPVTPVTPATPAAPAVDAKAGLPSAVKQDFVELDGQKIPVADLKKKLSLADGAQKAMQEADRLKKDYSNFFANMKTDPNGTLRNMVSQGLMTKEEAVKISTEWYRENVYEPSQLSKEEMAAKEAQRELDELKKEKEARTKAEAEAKAKADAEAAKRYVVGELQKAFKAHPEIPETADIIRFAAKHKNIAKAAGQPITYDEAVVRAYNELKDWSKRIAKAHNEDNIIDYLGEDFAELVNKAWLKRLKAKEKTANKPAEGHVPTTSNNDEKRLTRKQLQQKAIQETVDRISKGMGGR